MVVVAASVFGRLCFRVPISLRISQMMQKLFWVTQATSKKVAAAFKLTATAYFGEIRAPNWKRPF
jgi:hypothetical protein